jgi:FkbM family methyltransferase
MDVGASVIAEVPIYKLLLDRKLAHLNAFDGDERQAEKIKIAYPQNSSIYKDFLFDGTEQTVYLASPASGMTSLLQPHSEALEFFNGFDKFGVVERTERITTKRLDDVHDLPPIDLLKMDVQGAELTILKHGTRKLANCLAVQLEVSYICLYENQPTFGDVDVWMRSQGYVPHCFLDVKRWSIAPTIFNGNFKTPGNQLLESDIIYIRDPLRLEVLSDIQIKKLSILAHYCFKSVDLCVFLIRELEKRGAVSPNTHQQYLVDLKKVQKG